MTVNLRGILKQLADECISQAGTADSIQLKYIEDSVFCRIENTMFMGECVVWKSGHMTIQLYDLANNTWVFEDRRMLVTDEGFADAIESALWRRMRISSV
jgi:hypothetical protein